jgi:hypothetical protein
MSQSLEEYLNNFSDPDLHAACVKLHCLPVMAAGDTTIGHGALIEALLARIKALIASLPPGTIATIIANVEAMITASGGTVSLALVMQIMFYVFSQLHPQPVVPPAPAT